MATPASLKAKHFTKPLYNAATDFTPVVLITTQPTFLFVRPDLPAENPRELCKANDAKMQFGSAEAGDPLGLRADQFRDWHINVTHVPVAQHPRCRI
jgi:tripartite-type tricarboxylate transporter receptor subunit TctC